MIFYQLFQLNIWFFQSSKYELLIEYNRVYVLQSITYIKKQETHFKIILSEFHHVTKIEMMRPLLLSTKCAQKYAL